MSSAGGYVYLISSNIDGIVYYKIGKTRRDPTYRRDELNTGNQVALIIEDVFWYKHYHTLELMLHANFKTLRTNGEWFLSEKDKIQINIEEFRKACNKLVDTIEYMSENNEFFRRQLK